MRRERRLSSRPFGIQEMTDDAEPTTVEGTTLGDPAALVTYQRDRCRFKPDSAHHWGTLQDITET